MDALITSDELAARLGEPGLAIIDATMTTFDPTRDPAAEFAAGHIPGARFLHLASLRDMDDPLPNTLPTTDAVAERLAALGVSRDDAVVLYDDSPWRTAARAWFVLQTVGIEATLLDGGLAKWRAEGRALDKIVAPAEAGAAGLVAPQALCNAAALASAGATRTLAQVAAALADGSAQVVDARSAPRFAGVEPDPHGAAPGHMPGARNLPYARLFAADGTWLRGAALAAAFADAGIDPARPVIATCGSGVTAAVLLFGLHLLGREGALYDGSWSEWGARADTAKALGAAA